MEKLIVIILCLPLLCNGQASDQTLQPNARGEAVVNATIEKIRSNDERLMTRIAAVETDFGKNSVPNTRGIWRVTDAILKTVKNSCKSNMHNVCNEILQKFSFDITKATIAEMDFPLYSALVMNTYISLTTGKAVPASKSNQADFWMKHIQPKGDKNNFIAKLKIKPNDNDVPNPCTKANILNNKIRFKHPTMSNKYIQCKLTGQMEIVKCPRRTQYDESQRACHPQITGFSPMTGPYKGVNPCTHQALVKGQFYFPNPSDRSTFIQCNEMGTAFLLYCPKNTVWSQKLYTCVYHFKSDSSTSNPCQSSTDIPPSDGLYKGVNPCTKQALMKGQFYFPNPSDRSAFIQCNEMGTAFLLYCPNNTVWSQQAYSCVHNYNSNSSTFNPCKSATKSHPPYYENHDDRKTFIFCDKNGNAKIVQCPLGTVWLQAKLKCVNDSIKMGVITHTTPKVTSISPGNGLFKGVNPCTKQALMNGQFYFPNPSDRSTFIQCNEMGTAFLLYCPKNTVWSQKLYSCIYNFNSVSSTSNPCQSSTDIPTSDGLYKGVNPCTKQALMKGQFYFPNPSARSTFIQCNEMGTAFLVHCLKNMIWSPQAYTCVNHSSLFSL